MTIILIIGMLYMVVGLLISLICLFLKRYDSIGWTIALTLNIAGILNVIIYHATEAPSALDDEGKISFAHIVDPNIAKYYKGWNIPGVLYWMPFSNPLEF
jgi:hypothetical protein